MHNTHSLLLWQAAADILQQQAFMFAEEDAAGDATSGSAHFFRAAIHFSGNLNGAVGMAIPEALGLELAANMLGIDPGDELTCVEAKDAFGELLNVTCGHFLTKAYGRQAVFQLSIPEVTVIDKDGWRHLMSQHATVPFAIEDQPALIYAHQERNVT